MALRWIGKWDELEREILRQLESEDSEAHEDADTPLVFDASTEKQMPSMHADDLQIDARERERK